MIYSVPSHIHKMIRRRYEEDITHVSWGRSNRRIFFDDVFCGHSIKLEKVSLLRQVSILSIRCEETTGNSCSA